ncbi:MAG: sulfotransferase family 2 domain-containing protein [Roseiflexaceae bacterium]
MRYIFVHIPKTAGTSLFDAMMQQFGAHNILPQYGHRPPPDSWWEGAKEKALTGIRKQVWPHRYVVGHVPVVQYMDIQEDGRYTKRPGYRYMTFLRNPLDRAVSHYFYWQQINEPQNPQWVRFHTEQWSLEQFLLHPKFTNFHMRFIRGLDIDEFDFVGVVEEFEQSMKLLGRMFPEFNKMEVLQSRKTKFKNTDSIANLPQRVMDEFHQLHRNDYVAYERARQRVLRQSEEYMFKIS